MTKRQYLIIVIASISLLTLAGIVLVFVEPFSHATHDSALLLATWGMSPSEVQKALGVQLSKDVSEPYFDILDRPIAKRSRFSSFGISSDEFSIWGYQTKAYFNFFDKQLYQYKVELISSDSAGLDSTIVNQLSSKYGRFLDTTRTAATDNTFLNRSVWHCALVRVEYWSSRQAETHPNPSATKPSSPDDDSKRPRIGAKGKAKAEREEIVQRNTRLDSFLVSKQDNYIIPYEYVAIVRVTYLPIEKNINAISATEKKNIF